MPTAPGPGFASLDQGPAQPLAPRFRNHIKLGQEAMMTLGLDHEQLGILVMGESPSHGLFAVLGNQEDTMLFGAAMLQFAPMLHREIGIAPAVGLEVGLVILQAGDEREDRRFVGGQTCFANANGRAP